MRLCNRFKFQPLTNSDKDFQTLFIFLSVTQYQTKWAYIFFWKLKTHLKKNSNCLVTILQIVGLKGVKPRQQGSKKSKLRTYLIKSFIITFLLRLAKLRRIILTFIDNRNHGRKLYFFPRIYLRQQAYIYVHQSDSKQFRHEKYIYSSLRQAQLLNCGSWFRSKLEEKFEKNKKT